MNNAIYRTGGNTGSKKDGLVDLSAKLCIDLYLKLTIDLRGKLTTCMAGL